MREKDEAFRILEAALSIASSGVDEAEVALCGGELGLVPYADNQLHRTSQVVDERVRLRLGRDGRWVRVSTSDLSSSGLTAAARQARAEIDRLTELEPVDTLPPPQSYQEVRAYDDETAGLHPLERTALAARAITAALRAGVVASGRVAIGRGALGLDGQPRAYAVANTRGLLAYHASTLAALEVVMTSGAQVGRSTQTSVSASDLDPQAAIASALWAVEQRSSSRSLPAGRYTVVLEPPAVAALIRVIGRQVGAARLARGESFLAGRLGDQIVDPRITLVDDHRHPALLGAPFDADGVARQVVPLIEAGVAKGPVVAWSTSLHSEFTATGHRLDGFGPGPVEAAEHLVLQGGEGSTDRLIADVGAGVVISALEGLELVDAPSLTVTGSSAYGTFAIEAGRITGPVEDLRIEVSLLELLGRVRDLGAAVAVGGSVVPPLSVEAVPLRPAS